MGYRGSKSNNLNKLFVKEQRVDGSSTNKVVVRYTLRNQRNLIYKIIHIYIYIYIC